MDGKEMHALGQFMELASQCVADMPPDLMVIHLGGNNLAQSSGKSLVLQATADLNLFGACCPKTQIIWSEMIPCMM